MPVKNQRDAAARVTKLAELAEELRGGQDFPVTRLTVIKQLCQDAKAATRFGLHLRYSQILWIGS